MVVSLEGLVVSLEGLFGCLSRMFDWLISLEGLFGCPSRRFGCLSRRPGCLSRRSGCLSRRFGCLTNDNPKTSGELQNSQLKEYSSLVMTWGNYAWYSLCRGGGIPLSLYAVINHGMEWLGLKPSMSGL